jgi:acyl carrier protein
MARKLTPTESAIRDFLLEEIFYDKSLANLGPQEMLLDGLLDSIGILQTVTFCEQTFNINIPQEELIPEHFENIRAIARLVERRLADSQASL